MSKFTSPPCPPAQLSTRVRNAVDQKKRLCSALAAGVSPEGQRLYMAISKTINNEVTWNGSNIVVFTDVTITPPYQVENVGGNPDSRQLTYVRKIVEKFVRDQQHHHQQQQKQAVVAAAAASAAASMPVAAGVSMKTAASASAATGAGSSSSATVGSSSSAASSTNASGVSSASSSSAPSPIVLVNNNNSSSAAAAAATTVGPASVTAN